MSEDIRELLAAIEQLQQEHNEVLARVRELEAWKQIQEQGWPSKQDFEHIATLQEERDKALAQVKEIEKRTGHQEGQLYSDLEKHMYSRIAALEAENAKLKEALQIAGVLDKPMDRITENERLRKAFDDLCDVIDIRDHWILTALHQAMIRKR